MYKVYEIIKIYIVKNLVRARTCETPIISDDHENYFFFIKIIFYLIFQVNTNIHTNILIFTLIY